MTQFTNRQTHTVYMHTHELFSLLFSLAVDHYQTVGPNWTCLPSLRINNPISSKFKATRKVSSSS